MSLNIFKSLFFEVSLDEITKTILFSAVLWKLARYILC